MVITCSDTRTPDTDTSGQLIQKLLKEKGIKVESKASELDDDEHYEQL